MTWLMLAIAILVLAGIFAMALLYGYVPATYRYALRTVRSKNRRNVIAAAQYLGRKKNPEAVGGLISALKKPDPGIRKACIQALGSIGRPALDPLCQTFIQKDEELKFSAVEAIIAIDRTVSMDPLCKKLATSSSFIRQYVSEVIVRMGRELVEPLLRHAPDPVVSSLDERQEERLAVHENFVSVLVRIGKKEPDLLFQTIATGDKQRLLLAQALGRLDDERSPELLARVLQSKNPNIRTLAVDSLRDLGNSAVPAIVEILKGDNDSAKKGAVELLVSIGGDAHKALYDLITLDDPDIRLQGAIALGLMGRVRPLVTVLWPKKHVEVAYVIENGSNTKLDAIGAFSTLRKAIEQAMQSGRISKRYRARYYLQSLAILLYPDSVQRVDDPRLGRLLGAGQTALDHLGQLKLSFIHPLARRALEAPRPAKVARMRKMPVDEGQEAPV